MVLNKETKRSMEQNREPRNKPTPYGQLIYDKGARIHNGKDSFFIKLCWKNWTAIFKRVKLDNFLTPDTKVNAKWIIDLNVRPKAIKLLEEKWN